MWNTGSRILDGCIMVDIVFFMPRFFCKRVTSRVVIVNVPVIVLLFCHCSWEFPRRFCVVLSPLMLWYPKPLFDRRRLSPNGHLPAQSSTHIMHTSMHPSPRDTNFVVVQVGFRHPIFNTRSANQRILPSSANYIVDMNLLLSSPILG